MQTISNKGAITVDTAVNTLATSGEAHKTPCTSPNAMIRGHLYDGLMEQVLDRENMMKALHRVELNRGAPGIDGMRVKLLHNHLINMWPLLKSQLLLGTYKPQPVRRVEIPKAGGGVRQLGIPTVIDRMIQQAVQQILTPIFEKEFLTMSYGFRPGRGAHQAVRQAQKYVQKGYCHVADIDFENFFDRVNHDTLMGLLQKRIGDHRILRLIRSFLQTGVMLNGCCITSEEGTPQGGPLSPLLANVMLHELDVELANRGHKAVRYADDVTIYVKSRSAASRVLASITRFAERTLKLRVNQQKSAAAPSWKRKILGYVIGNGEGNVLWLSPNALTRVKSRIKELTRGHRDRPIAERIEALNKYLGGWLQYFKLAAMNERTAKLDGWIRRRLRMCMLKQWKLPRTKWRKLIELGLSNELACMGAYSRKGPWRMSHSPSMDMAMGKSFWRKLGLVSVNEMYKKVSLVL